MTTWLSRICPVPESPHPVFYSSLRLSQDGSVAALRPCASEALSYPVAGGRDSPLRDAPVMGDQLLSTFASSGTAASTETETNPTSPSHDPSLLRRHLIWPRFRKMIDGGKRARCPKRGGGMRGGRVIDCGDTLRRDVSEAGWVDQCREDSSSAGNSGRQGLRGGRGYRPGDDASRYRGRYAEFGKREQ